MRFYREERCQARIYQARIYQAERYRQGYIRQRDMGRDISYRVILDKNLSGEGEDLMRAEEQLRIRPEEPW